MDQPLQRYPQFAFTKKRNNGDGYSNGQKCDKQFVHIDLFVFGWVVTVVADFAEFR